MIKTNLISKKSVRIYNPWKYAAVMLLLLLLFQATALVIKYLEVSKKKEDFDLAMKRLNSLRNQAENLETSENLQQLAGKVAERNNWYANRRSSPLNKLAKLQRDCPTNVKFLFYSADITSGKIVLAAPDLNSVSSWLNSLFGNSGNISVTGREKKSLLIQFVWSG
ncbi:MAG: hypothetical protein PHV05_07185 [Candidatus Riflebacteria bacterium]|nr:hypothetical protein [Candidatus Riflebacteria bacterium]